MTVKVRSDIPVEFVTKSLFGPEGAVYENDIVTEFEKGQFPDGGIQPDVWIFKWLDNIPDSMPEGSYTYGKINVTNFDGIISEDWPDVSFLYNKIKSFTPERPIEFDGNFVNWEFVAPDKGYGFLRMKIYPISHSRSRRCSILGLLQLRIDLITHPLRRYLGMLIMLKIFVFNQMERCI